ncbi:MAG: acyl-CoA N-acyltransferase [Benniella sp.]|nr:MAG: acyl-CoA N-acyltransferase [Benniella sp.]
MSLTIRGIKREDQEEVHDLVLEGLAERWGAEFDPSYNQDLVDIIGYYVEGHRATVVVLEYPDQGSESRSVTGGGGGGGGASSHRIVGCGILLPLPAEDIYGTWCPEPASRIDDLKGLKLCRMMRLSVSKVHRGKGFAKQIIQHLINMAKEQGFDRILVETETLWTSAVQIYKSMGFVLVESGEENVHFEYTL